MSAIGRGLFVTGTDTGVGKTEIACALVRAIARQQIPVLGMKPIAAGARKVRGVLRNGDVEALARAGTVRVARRLRNPYLLSAAIAPHLAAQDIGIDLDVEVIVAAYRQLARRARIVVVEGVGGFLVPLSLHKDTGHLAQRLGLPVVLVVGMRLGCLSHALLTAEAISKRGLILAGWVANRIDPGMRRYRNNVRALQDRLPAPLLAQIPFRVNAPARRAAADRTAMLDPLLPWLLHGSRSAVHHS